MEWAAGMIRPEACARLVSMEICRMAENECGCCKQQEDNAGLDAGLQDAMQDALDARMLLDNSYEGP